MSNLSKQSEEQLLSLFSANFNDGEPIETRVGSKDMWSAGAIVEFIKDFAAPYANQRYKEGERAVIDAIKHDCMYNYSTWGNGEKMLSVSGIKKRLASFELQSPTNTKGDE